MDSSGGAVSAGGAVTAGDAVSARDAGQDAPAIPSGERPDAYADGPLAHANGREATVELISPAAGRPDIAYADARIQSVTVAPSVTDRQPDGRAARWDDHRARRREELVDATLRAIKRHGAGVTIEDIAEVAGTSKPILYRYFHDRTGLYLQVAERVADNILAGLLPLFDGEADVSTMVRALADGYTTLVDKDREIYRFVINRPLVDLPSGDDPITGVSERLAAAISVPLAEHLRRTGGDPAAAETLAHGLVGFVRAATNHWLTESATGTPRPRELVVDEVAHLFGTTIALAPPP